MPSGQNLPGGKKLIFLETSLKYIVTDKLNYSKAVKFVFPLKKLVHFDLLTYISDLNVKG